MDNKRTRNNRIYFHLTDIELALLTKRMESVGVKNRDGFIRKLALDGFIVQLDIAPIAELVRLIKNATTNINQIAKRANETGSVYENDVLDLSAELSQIVPLVVKAHSTVASLSKGGIQWQQHG